MTNEQVFGIDVGGSGVKGAPVDVTTGELLTERKRIPTPRPATPQAVLDVAAEVASFFTWSGGIGCAVPAVVEKGIVRTAANIHQSWIGVDAAAMMRERTGCAVAVINDADAAGLAEMRYGAGRGEDGVVILLTFGTGIGSALFASGKLLPNSELGHLEFRGGLAEHYAAARLVEEEEMPLELWAKRVEEYLHHLERVLTPDLIILGGGISKRYEDFADSLRIAARLEPAAMRNNAGIVGAALAASSGERKAEK